jgi:tRNA(fMet)-specific endonuclease VapC
MLFMLDTNICIYVIRNRPAEVLVKLKRFNPADLAISVVTVCELEYGASKSSNPARNRETLSWFLAPFEICPFDARAAFHYGEIRAQLERKGSPIGAMDLLIAAHARSLSLPLVTNNLREFERVSGLRTENWT